MSALTSVDLSQADVQLTLADESRLLVACLCAEWCGTCREFRAAFDALAARHPEVTFIWLDVEDDSELVDEFEVENFPTVVIEQSQQMRFNGTVLPQAALLERLLTASPADGEPSKLRQALLAQCAQEVQP